MIKHKKLNESHPAWVCGLKQLGTADTFGISGVTPCVGVWIETSDVDVESYINKCHTLRGCVD